MVSSCTDFYVRTSVILLFLLLCNTQERCFYINTDSVYITLFFRSTLILFILVLIIA